MASTDVQPRPLLGPKTHLAFFTLCEILVYFDRGLIAGLNLYLKDSLNLTDFEVGLLGGMFILGYVVASPLFAILGQVSGVWTIRSICIGLIVWVIANVLTGVVPTSFGLIVACRTLTGVGEAAFCSLAPPIIDDSAPPGKGSTFLGIFFMALYVGQALGYVGSGFFSTWESGQYAFLGEALIMVVIVVLAFIWRNRFKVPARRPAKHEGSLLKQFLVLASNPTYMTLIFGYSAFMFAVGGFAYWGPAVIQEIWKASQTVGSMGFGALTVICGILGTLLGGYVLDVMSRKLAGRKSRLHGLFAGFNVYLGKEGLGFSDVEVGILGGLFILGFVVMSPLFARIGQISGVWTIRSIYIGMILWIITNGVMALVPSSFWLLLVCRTINGGAGSALVSLAPPILDDAAPPGKNSLYLGIFFVALYVGQALGYLIAGFFSSWETGKYVFGVEALVMIVFAFLAYWWERRFEVSDRAEGDEPRESLARQLVKLGKNPIFMCLSFGFSAFMFTVGGFGFWGPALIQYIYDTSQTVSTIAFGAVTVVCGIFGTLIGGLALDYLTVRWAKSRSRLFVASLLSAAPIAVSWAVGVGAPWVNNLAGFLAMLTIIELFLLMSTAPCNVAVMDSVPASLRGQAVAVLWAITHAFGDFPSPLLMGWWNDTIGHRWSLWICVCWLIFGAILWSVATVLSRNDVVSDDDWSDERGVESKEVER
ncbi:Protein spinster 3 [Perkinsus olseni]|uniref:Protein spinster 3 n=1 Tax=Perkinsus olseni TaxID=32597 RepID=A0A7J6MIX9_PEROL|nr:Protein spinster 3 [Perkinsus olseni]KAF4671582.1 Protein spinster 3 [Perkinsus olseni]